MSLKDVLYKVSFYGKLISNVLSVFLLDLLLSVMFIFISSIIGMRIFLSILIILTIVLYFLYLKYSSYKRLMSNLDLKNAFIGKYVGCELPKNLELKGQKIINNIVYVCKNLDTDEDELYASECIKSITDNKVTLLDTYKLPIGKKIEIKKIYKDHIIFFADDITGIINSDAILLTE